MARRHKSRPGRSGTLSSKARLGVDHFQETEHPRGFGGKFAEKGGGEPTPKTRSRSQAAEKSGARASPLVKASPISPSDKIYIVVKGNPKKGTAAERFGRYKSGMTVQDYVDAVGDKKQALRDLAWDHKQGWVKVGGKSADKEPDAPRRAQPEKASESAGRSGDAATSTRHDGSSKIKIHAEGNPKKSTAAARYAKYKEGMTVDEYVEAIGGDKKQALKDIAWDEKQGWISLGKRQERATEQASDVAKKAETAARKVEVEVVDSVKGKTPRAKSLTKEIDDIRAEGGSLRLFAERDDAGIDRLGYDNLNFYAARAKGLARRAAEAGDKELGLEYVQHYKRFVESRNRVKQKSLDDVEKAVKAKSRTFGSSDLKVEHGGGVSPEFMSQMDYAMSRTPDRVKKVLAASGVTIQTAPFITETKVFKDLGADPRSTPSGYPPGLTSDAGGGMYFTYQRVVTVSEKTRGRLDLVRHNHRAATTMHHEVGHAFDRGGGDLADRQEFIKAYQDDVEELSKRGNWTAAKQSLAYFLQPGRRGREEVFAEGYAVHVSGQQAPSGIQVATLFPRSHKLVVKYTTED